MISKEISITMGELPEFGVIGVIQLFKNLKKPPGVPLALQRVKNLKKPPGVPLALQRVSVLTA